ncbi:RNA polymerase sigma factor [Bacillus alkalisoli]|uniref:RNA polymerase sigma factor n=1 Tax=Bacillus alkalisoli TaxID=2011008 RepID=UPI000C24423C|nr:sigma-70 family RNA polymerase sigma factor [Bacillus alkalisoli]
MSNEQQISDWFQQYSDDIYQFLLYRLSSTDVEDHVQEVFIKAFRGSKRFKGDSSPKTWLFSIARNVAIDELRKRKREKWKSMLLFENKSKEEQGSTDLTPEKLYFLSEEHKEIITAIHSLNDTYQEVLIMRGVKELSVEETAEVLGWSHAKVRSTHYRAKQALLVRLGGNESGR